MKRLNKIFIIAVLCLVICAILCVTSFAAEPEVTPDSESSVEPENSISLDDFEFVFKYTSDSVTTEGLTYQTYTDPVSAQSGVELVQNFGIGYTIYDNPETDIIDGIRINGSEVTSLRIPIDSKTEVFKYEIAVRTVYAEGASGDLAQILDGTYDYTRLLTNPVIIFQLIYWIFMAIAGFVGLVTAIRSKNTKVKTSDEIASKVTENMSTFETRVVEIVTESVKSEILPLAQASVKSGKEAVKAILLSTSKSKDAPSALLDVFKESSDIDISSIVDEVREELNKSITEHDTNRSANIATLHSIANHVIQEDVSNATETKQDSESVKSHKSVF